MISHTTPSNVGALLAYASSLWRRGPAPYAPDVFRHFLAVERKRAEQSKRPVLVALVSMDSEVEPNRMSPLVGARVLAGLAQTVREVDFIGWYRQDYVAGAVLVQGTAPADVAVAVEQRVRRAVCGHLPAGVRDSVRVTVRRLTRRVMD